jgi:peptidoglycan hydrolase-like protein with peptidoglycan-binding domain
MPIKASVGQGGANKAADVTYIQLLLNDARGRLNLPLLAVDGIAGPKTIAAIRQFQAGAHTGSDGRLDPKGPTIRALEDAHIAALAISIRPRYPIIALGRFRPASTPGQPTAREAFEEYLEALRKNLT